MEVSYINPRSIFFNSLRYFIPTQLKLWRLNLIDLILSGMFYLIMYFFVPTFTNQYGTLPIVIAMAFSLAFLFFYFYLFFWVPFFSRLTYMALIRETKINFRDIVQLLGQNIKDKTTLKEYRHFTLNGLRTYLAVDLYNIFLVSRFLGRGEFSEFSLQKGSLDEYYPFYLQDKVPFLLIDGKDPKQIFSLPKRLDQESKKTTDKFLYDEVTIILLLNSLPILIQLTILMTILIFGKGEFIKIFEYLSIYSHSPRLGLFLTVLLIFTPFMIVCMIIGKITSLFNFYTYKFFWQKYIF